MNRNIACVILAAGKGKRMKSDLPKVLHPVCGRPMLEYVMDLVKELKISTSVLVLGHQHELVSKTVRPQAKIVIQKKLQGSADAVRQAEKALKDFKGTVLVLYADNALLRKDSLKKLIRYHMENKAEATLLTARVKNPSGYGRILRDKYESICRIVEEKDADAFQKDIKEINIGCACFEKTKLFSALKKVKRNRLKKEFYLTDVIEILYKQNLRVEAVHLADVREGWGINSRVDLAKVNKIMQERILKAHLEAGIGIVDPQSTFVDWGVKIGVDSKIYPFTVIERNVTIGRRCSIGPFCHLREQTVIEDDCAIGNFSELARSRVGKHTLAKHFCYLGDSRIGNNVNIGAGVVTANFDGKRKNTTLIKDNAFLGSDTILIAPVRVGRHAVTGAGSVISRNKHVGDYAVVAGVPARQLKKKMAGR
jgi:bifunctional UDP-N-acetylglucosamine pyrophosphorylase/glucosamine-1-phosphate N-acetyltransferase